MARMPLLALAATLALPVEPPQDARKWAQAQACFQKYSGSRDPLERARAVDELGAATFDKADKACWALVSQTLRRELAQESRGENQVSGDVAEACLGALRRIAHKDVLTDILKTARNARESPRFRMYLLWTLGARGEPRDFLEFADDPSPLLQIAALDALVERADPSLGDLFLRILGQADRPWEAKLAALRGIEKLADEKHVEPLLDALGKCRPDEGRLKDLYLKILKERVGVDLASDDPNAWRAAWTARKAGQDPAQPGSGTVAEPTEFFGLKTRSTRIVFLLDRTGSMNGPGSESPRTVLKLPPEAAGGPQEHPSEARARDEATRIRKQWDGKMIATRMDSAKKELINTVYVLRPSVHFNVIWYEGHPDPWKPELVPATWAHKLDCIREAEKLAPSGMTNIWDALELALRMTEVPQRPGAVVIDKKANYATALDGADTFFLMTDGRPSAGRLSNALDILAELRKVNRLRRIAIHTVCVGDEAGGGGIPGSDSPDPAFMKRVAEENGGEFVHIR